MLKTMKVPRRQRRWPPDCPNGPRGPQKNTPKSPGTVENLQTRTPCLSHTRRHACFAVPNFIVLSLAVAFKLGCLSAPEHTNPYDPESPAEIQRLGTITGKVLLERASDHSGVIVLSTGGQTTSTSPDGAFRMNDVRQGVYGLIFFKEGYENVSVSEVPVEIGQTVDIGVIEIRVARGVVVE